MNRRSPTAGARRRAAPAALVLAAALSGLSGLALASDPPADAEMRAWIREMKDSPRGPFHRIRWFCEDGSILAPEPYACRDRGGGHQHGEWTDRVRTLRDQGFLIANVYADLDVDALLARARPGDAFAQLLVEQFLVGYDDGWILRRARSYRGAFQAEGERAGKRALLLALAQRPEWLDRRYLLLRTGAALLDHGAETASAREMRQLSAALADRDPGFAEIRNEIHAAPGPDDAGRVRAYAAGVSDEALAREYERLATVIESVYAGPPAASTLERLSASAAGAGDLDAWLRAGAAALTRAAGPGDRLSVSARLMAELRDRVLLAGDAALRLALVDASRALEAEHLRAGAALAERIGSASRREHTQWLRAAAVAGYGAGLVSGRQRDALEQSMRTLDAERVEAGAYKRTLDYLALVPGWADAWLRFHFGAAVDTLARIEPLARLYPQDHLRSSPLLFHARVLDHVLRDANRLAGVRNELFGDDVGAGLRALNPGLARGTLRLALDEDPRISADGIFVLPETVADLPPVAGILTLGEGNPLSHVQLLARNLGIPNVAVDRALLPRLEEASGLGVMLAVSPGGSVRLTRDGERLAGLFAREARHPEVVIRPDLGKLDLSVRALARLSDLRAADSGRTVGPKAAKLGELAHHYPEAVAEGLAIPFGVFRALLESPLADGPGSLHDWMVAGYRRLETMAEGSPERARATEEFRDELHERVLSADPESAFRERLHAAMRETFGPDGTYGVFVRSDTNVEDLPGFTGAGLNLTVPNVVGFDEVLAAISRVWASPFSERAFAWRQARMSAPEHVYPAVLLMRSVPAEKSGVLVTADLDSGEPGRISVAVNEGVGGAVEGQAAESLRIDPGTGEVRLLAQATARERRVLDPDGGVSSVPVSGAERVLEPDEIRRLVRFARDLPDRFPPVVGADGEPVPADVEFGFVEGRLVLFQIRPFVESARARESAYLAELDAGLEAGTSRTVDLTEVPRP